MSKRSIQRISVIVPMNPFAPADLQETRHCLTALNVEKLMQWWPGKPHTPRHDADKVRSIQRSLDWKRVAKIAAYLLQKEIVDAPKLIDKYFRNIYEPKKLEPGREWPPKVQRVVGFQNSEYPTFSNVLLHVNGALVKPLEDKQEAATLTFDEEDKALSFSVIDGQHRINGAFLALRILQEENRKAVWDIPAEIFLDLDPPNEAPRRQAQIFIDVNFNQKKVDKSLVADLFPTARGSRAPLDDKERAQDLGRRLMLETGPLVGMIQIPGIKYGVPDVVALATLNSAIEEVIPIMRECGIDNLDQQTEFLAQCLDAWLEATGRKQEVSEGESLDPDNVAYQGRVLVSFLTLLPVCISKLKRNEFQLISDRSHETLIRFLHDLMRRGGLLEREKFLPKPKFKEKGFLGSGGVSRFRDLLWAAATSTESVARLKAEALADRAAFGREKFRSKVQDEFSY
ncbi:MAG: DGQHR domain-containing protein [Nitrospira sp.]|mgnify:CR=1 FL=1|jgi:DGQHR domain-containing protein|nr:DGQHR domain-containing protein [Nitrospira sp.]MBX3339594.1 DGQHR domain-containing protein [Nitrospira sp.]MCC7471771.1 DGQHR domain-containing protein [Candidatus Nomurabacteria bacterium]